jgi:hypothetical protein
MTKTDIYIHIGSGKTGTGAIQAFMNNNREILFSKHSCLYPNTNTTVSEYTKGNCRAHVDFFKNKSEPEIIQEIHSIIAFSNRNNVQKIVFSWEGLFERYKFARVIKDALAGCNNCNVHIILYLRRQDHWLESAWKQWFSVSKEYKDFDHFVDSYTITWDGYLNAWSDVFGKGQTFVQPYESIQLEDGLIANFLTKIGIRYQDNHWIEDKKTEYNLGLHEDIIEILHLNREFYSDHNSSHLQNFFSRYLPEEYKKKPFEKYSLIPPKKRIEILNRYEPMNRYIAEHFLKRADGRLFYEPGPSDDDPWKQTEGLTVEKLVPVFTYLLYSLDRKTKKVTPLLKK